MKVNQLAVFLENRKGRICDCSKVLGENKINIKAMVVADSEEFGILRVITDNNKKAEELLKASGFNTSSSNLLGFLVGDKPGEMYKALTILGNENINIGYLYSYTLDSKAGAVILVKVDDNDKAEKVLLENGIDLGGDDLI